MKRKSIFKMRGTRLQVLLSLPLLAVAASPASAVTYNLVAGATNITPAGSATAIPMWGFGCADQLCVDAVVAAGGTATVGGITVPGPKLSVPVGDTSLTINLTNNLPAAGAKPAEPVSIVIDGLPMPDDGAPVYVTDANGKPRVQSLTTETAAGGAHSYTWSSVKPGTFIYRSGTHMQVQDQMGLYGAVTHDAAVGQAYNAATAYDKDVTLLYSEIDPVIHTAVAAGTFGRYPATGTDQCTLPVSAPRTLPPGWVCSTVNYDPKFFLVNGQPYAGTGTNEFVAGKSGQKTLVRFLNAGLQTHVPVINGLDMTLVAEDGNLYPYVKTQYSAFLPAMKTVDAIIAPTLAANATSLKVPVTDRMQNLSNNGVGNGGMLAYLTVAPGTANAPQFDLTGCLSGPLHVGASSSVTCNLSAHSTVSPPPTTAPTFTYSILSGPTYVTLLDNTITAEPAAADVSGLVTVQVTESNGASTTATFNVVVTDNTAPIFNSTPVTTATVGSPYSYTATAVDAEVPATQALTFSAVTVPAGMTITSEGVISWTPGAIQSGLQNVTIRVTDSGSPAITADQSFTINVSLPNTAPIITSAPVTTATVGLPYSYTVTATDNDVPAQNLTFSAVTVPNGMSITPAGVISWTPGATQSGSQNVTIGVTDNGTPVLSANQVFSVVVVANRAPVVVNDVYTVNRNSVGNQLTILTNDSDTTGSLNTASVLINSLPSGWTRTLINNATQARYSKATRFNLATCTNVFTGASVDGNGRCVMPANQYVLPKLGFAIVNSGVLTYRPALNFSGTESFGYSVADTLGLRSSGNVRVNVK